MNEKGGCAGSVINLLNTPGLPQQVETETGVLQSECSEILSRFFQNLRDAKTTAKSNITAANEDVAESSEAAAPEAAPAPDEPVPTEPTGDAMPKTPTTGTSEADGVQ